MTAFIILIALVIVSFAAGYFVGSKNPAQSVKDKLTAELKAKL